MYKNIIIKCIMRNGDGLKLIYFIAPTTLRRSFWDCKANKFRGQANGTNKEKKNLNHVF